MWIDRADRDLTWKQIPRVYGISWAECVCVRLELTLHFIAYNQCISFCLFDILAVYVRWHCIAHSYAVISCEILWMPKCILIYRVKENERMSEQREKMYHQTNSRVRTSHTTSQHSTQVNYTRALRCSQQMTKTSNLNNVDWLLMHKILSLSNPKYSKVKFSIVSPFFHINFSFSVEQICSFSCHAMPFLPF